MSLEARDTDLGQLPPKKARERPAMQIYRPPGLRGGVPNNGTASPTSPLSNKSLNTKLESDRASNASSESQSSSNKSDRPKKQTKQPNKHLTERKKFKAKEFDEIINILQRLDLSKEQQLVDDFIGTSMESNELGEALGLFLARHAIEEQPKQSQRVLARLSAALIECPSGPSFHKGLLSSLAQYFECRDQLRQTHLKVWIGFLNFLSDIYANMGFTYEGGIVEIIFQVFDFLLQPPVLDTLKIEELECLIATLLSVGYDLERNCPDQLGSLRNQLRDAFVQVHEPWARKMLLLLMELSASGWSLPMEANEYYFQ